MFIDFIVGFTPQRVISTSLLSDGNPVPLIVTVFPPFSSVDEGLNPEIVNVSSNVGKPVWGWTIPT